VALGEAMISIFDGRYLPGDDYALANNYFFGDLKDCINK
jgi:hypothetical protein